MKKILLHISFSMIALLTCYGALAQGMAIERSTISARIVDEFGEPLKGALVVSFANGTTQVTDINGAFAIEALSTDYLNITPEGSADVVTIAKVSGGELESEDIVVRSTTDYANTKTPVSYGTLAFDRVTGSVDRISGDEMSIFPSHYALEALAGRLSGLSIGFSETATDVESFTATLRSQSVTTFVDGLPMDISMNIDEIDDVILAKDNGSLSLFGPMATTGALMVNTKNGRAGEFSVNASLATGARRPVQLPELMNSYQYATYINQAMVNDGASAIYSDEALAAYASNSNLLQYPDHDYYSELVDNPALYQDVSLSIAGGNEIVQYYTHLGYYGTTGIESVGSGRSTSTMRLNSNLQINLGEYVDLDLAIGADFYSGKGPSRSSSSVFSTIWSYPPNAIPWKISEDVYAYTSSYSTNLLADLTEQSVIKSESRNSYSRLGLNYDLSQLVKGLSFNAMVGLSVDNAFKQVIAPTANKAIPVWTTDADGNSVMSTINYVEGATDSSWARYSDDVIRNTYTVVGFNHDYVSSDGAHQVNTTLNYANNSSETDTTLQIIKNQVFGLRSNYMLNQKYVIEGNLMLGRGQSLDIETRNKLFYTGGIGWLMHKEDFLSDVSWIDYLKFRANAGLVGVSFFEINSDSNSYFLYDSLYESVGPGGSFGTESSSTTPDGRYVSHTGAEAGTVDWPKHLSYNAGFDFTLLGGHMQGQLNYFFSRYYDQLVLPTNTTTFFGSNSNLLPYINLVDTQRQGFDARVTYKNNIGDLKYTIDATAMYSVLYNNQLNALEYDDEYSYRNTSDAVGGLIYGLEADGLFQSEEEIANSPHQSFGSTQVGDIKYVDYNEDGVIDQNDYHEIGHSSRFSFGLNFGFQYKGFGLWIATDGMLGGTRMNDLTWDRSTSNNIVDALNSWPASDKYPRSSIADDSNNYINSTFWSVNASYFNLRSVTFSYDLPKSVVNKMSVRGVKLYVAGKNLGTLSYDNLTYPLLLTSGYSVSPVLNTFEIGADILF